MPNYAAVVGHQPKISIAELAAAFPGFRLLDQTSKTVVRFEANTEIDAAAGNALGGTVLLAREIALRSTLNIDDIPSLLASELKDIRGKATFSIRAFGLPHAVIHRLYRDGKAKLRKIGRPSRYIGTERKPALPVLLHDTGILDGKHGCELFLVAEEPRRIREDEPQDLPLWIGRTIFAQDVASYTERDIGKPARDTTAGLLPPKLAQVLLNFGIWLVGNAKSQIPKTKKGSKQSLPPTPYPLLPTIYDPFCGMGVIPMEAMLRGLPVFASDLSQKAVNATERNLEWLRKVRSITKGAVPSTVWKQDAVKPFALKTPPSVIVTETTLGPPLASRVSIREAQKFRTEAEAVEIAFLRNVAESLPRVPIVCTWPVWFTSKGAIHLERTWDALHDCGFRATLPPGIESDVKGRLSLLYRRPDQFVGREILLLQPTRK